MKDNVLLELMKPVRRRLTTFTVIRYTLLGLFGGSILGLLLIAASRIWPILDVRVYVAAAVGLGLCVGVAIGWWKRASVRETARTMDKSGTEDAIVTALDGLERADLDAQPIVRLQREAATEAAQHYVGELHARLPWPAWSRWRKPVYGVAAVWVVTAAMLLWPNPQDDRAEALAQARDQLAQLEREAEKLAEQADGASLPEEAKQELLQPLEELRSKLDALSGDPLAALEQLEAAMRELEKTADLAKRAAERLSAAAKEMSGDNNLRQLAEAMQDRDAEGVSKAIDSLRSELQRLTPEQREAMADLLEKLAAEQPQQDSQGNSDLASAIKQAAEQAREGGHSAGEKDGLEALEDALTRELSQEELEQLARSMAGRLGQEGEELAGQAAAAGAEVPSAWDGGAAGSGGSAGEGSSSGTPAGSGGSAGGQSPGQGGSNPNGGQGTSPGSGQGQGSGSGAGAGSGQGSGSGAGQGSGSGTGAGSGQGAGAGMGTGGRSLVTTPRHLAGSGNTQQDGGPSTGGQTQTGGKSPMIDGMTRPYEEVYNEYAAEAKESLGRSQLPASMQDKVKHYFEQIQPNR
ncbi:hypothetical protein [Paenibacillus harenae]|uniref:Biopolymer transport protein ExbB/TolQ n=1 Tax=Paenibacillus harenae TaxID=306543 RepID=A0ABT9UCH6_PAEHA|nr:hypothetical protein [Paenibacillus harenae]MDQ0116681.1 biopolymer transport protein ExbB/TolQ [Paenibacillus harenae]